MQSLELFKKHRVKMGFGSDLLGEMHRHQSREFLIRSEVLTPHEIITSATAIGAEIVRMEGKLGVLAPGAFADLLVVEGDPLANIGLLEGQGENLKVIMKGGAFVKNDLA